MAQKAEKMEYKRGVNMFIEFTIYHYKCPNVHEVHNVP